MKNFLHQVGKKKDYGYMEIIQATKLRRKYV